MSYPIDINCIKRITGGDAFYQRTLNDDPIIELTAHLTGPVKPLSRQPTRNKSRIFKYHKAKL
jgi:hypothetical protein